MVEFGSLVDAKITARFPRRAFLVTLDVVDPREWAQFCFQYTPHPLSIDSKEWKLTTEFLKKFTTLETQFCMLLPSATV